MVSCSVQLNLKIYDNDDHDDGYHHDYYDIAVSDSASIGTIVLITVTVCCMGSVTVCWQNSRLSRMQQRVS